MIYKVLSVYDGRIKAFMRPFVDQHTGSALRGFEEACKEPSSPLYKFPSDFVLYEVGTFDDESGEIESYSPKIQIAAAVDYASRRAAPLTTSPMHQTPEVARVSS